jgi:hypothetical protein
MAIKGELLKLSKEQLKFLVPVTTTTIMDGNFPDSDGLYSEDIFGPIGSESRLDTPSYIELNTAMITPDVWEKFLSLSVVYEKVAKGIMYVVLDDGEFIQTDANNGNTGMGYLFKVFKDIKLKKTKSQSRLDKIKLIEDAIKDDKLFIEQLLVIPAGIRDITFDENGRPVEIEINDFYKRILVHSRALNNLTRRDVVSGLVDPLLLKLQTAITDIHDYFIDINNGKNKFLRAKFTKRRVTFATRNVITGYAPDFPSLKNVGDGMDMNTMIMGVYQFCMAYQPLIIAEVKRDLANQVSRELGTSAVILIKDNKYQSVSLSGTDSDILFTDDGILKLVHRLRKKFNKPIYIDGYGLRGINKEAGICRLVNHSEDVSMRIVTYGEYFTILANRIIDHVAGISTRHPTTGLGSTLPNIPKLKPSIKTVKCTVDGTLVDMPSNSEPYSSMSISFTRLGALGGDHDGDKMDYDGVFTKEAVAEIKALLNSRAYYIDQSGGLNADLEYDVINNISISLTNTGVKL